MKQSQQEDRTDHTDCHFCGAKTRLRGNAVNEIDAPQTEIQNEGRRAKGYRIRSQIGPNEAERRNSNGNNVLIPMI